MIIFCSKSNFSDLGAAYQRVKISLQTVRPLALSAAYQNAKNAAYRIFWENCDLMLSGRMKWGHSGSPYYFHYLNNSVQIHVYGRAKQMPVNINGGLDIHMPDQSGNMSDIYPPGGQARHGKVTEVVKPLNSMR